MPGGWASDYFFSTPVYDGYSPGLAGRESWPVPSPPQPPVDAPPLTPTIPNRPRVEPWGGGFAVHFDRQTTEDLATAAGDFGGALEQPLAGADPRLTGVANGVATGLQGVEFVLNLAIGADRCLVIRYSPPGIEPVGGGLRFLAVSVRQQATRSPGLSGRGCVAR